MKIWGKIICGFFGWLLSAGSPFGLAFGVWIGHSFDKGLNQNFSGYFKHSDPAKIQTAFFTCSFSVMGHIAKADGVVSAQEIAAAEQVINRLGLFGERRQQAIDAFSEGKSDSFDLHQSLQTLIIHCARQPNLIQMFLEIQILAAVADGTVSTPEMNVLYQIAEAFRLPTSQIDRLVEMVIAQQSFHGNSQGGNGSSSGGPTLAQAYKVLGVDAKSNKVDIKRAYRKLMAEHHPDKLVAKGLPQEMLQMATEKSQEIQAAYEMVKKQHQF